MKVSPLYDRVLIRPLEVKEAIKGGIIIPDTAKERPQEGEIVAVGDGKLTEDGKIVDLKVKKGDVVLYSKYAGTEVELEGIQHLIMRESDILAVVCHCTGKDEKCCEEKADEKPAKKTCKK